ncbi:MAG TPA: hypothetical protein VFN11_15035, partial [Ktedonobacterales bacterium]|nr:hypothetical protein [Ktedonobacterales bacterium]
PAQWLQGRTALAQTLIWGTALGPGLITWNPYAGMWFLLIVLTWSRDALAVVVLGMCIGLVHGVTRALAILYAHRNRGVCGIGFGLTQWRWRVADGSLLLGAAGSCIALALHGVLHVAG